MSSQELLINLVQPAQVPNNSLVKTTSMTLDLNAGAAFVNITCSRTPLTPVTPEAASEAVTTQNKLLNLVTIENESQETKERNYSLPIYQAPSTSINFAVGTTLIDDKPLAINGTISTLPEISPHESDNEPKMLRKTSVNLPSSSMIIKPLVDCTTPTTPTDIEAFAKFFKQRRIALGFTQEEVGLALGTLYGSMYSQTTICRFEVLQLSFKKMCSLKELLERWLVDATQKVGDGGIRKRKKRMTIDSTMKAVLEQHYILEKKPKGEDITQIASEVQLDKEVVRVWFCNRRQKDRRLATLADDCPKDIQLTEILNEEKRRNSDS